MASRRRLRTVAVGCGRTVASGWNINAAFGGHSFPQTPKVKRKSSLCIRENRMFEILISENWNSWRQKRLQAILLAIQFVVAEQIEAEAQKARAVQVAPKLLTWQKLQTLGPHLDVQRKYELPLLIDLIVTVLRDP